MITPTTRNFIKFCPVVIFSAFFLYLWFKDQDPFITPMLDQTKSAGTESYIDENYIHIRDGRSDLCYLMHKKNMNLINIPCTYKVMGLIEDGK
jgi:hypothetical protein